MNKSIFICTLFFITLSCKRTVEYQELFSPKPPEIKIITSQPLYVYNSDTVKSLSKISNSTIRQRFWVYDKNNNFKNTSIQTVYYTIPLIYSNIKPKDGKLPYQPVNLTDNKAFYNYIRSNTNSIFIGYIVSENKVVFKDFIQEYKNHNENNITNNEKLFKYLNDNNIKYKIINEKSDVQSGRFFSTLKIYSKKDSTINYLVLSKFEFEMRTYYNADTLTNWNRITSEKFRY